MDHPQGILRTGDRATVTFEFISHPEFLKEGMKLLFREGKTKVGLAFLHLCHAVIDVACKGPRCCDQAIIGRRGALALGRPVFSLVFRAMSQKHAQAILFDTACGPCTIPPVQHGRPVPKRYALPTDLSPLVLVSYSCNVSVADVSLVDFFKEAYRYVNIFASVRLRHSGRYHYSRAAQAPYSPI